MKASRLALLCAAVALVLTACAPAAPAATKIPVQTLAPAATAGAAQPAAPAAPAPAPEQPQTIAPVAQPTVSIDGSLITVRDDGTGEDASSGSIDKTVVVTTRNINYTGEAGPMVYTINSIQLAHVTATDASAASMIGTTVGERATLFAIDVTVENTSDKDMTWYPYMSEIVTNTKEQCSSLILISDSVGGDFYGNVIKSGQIYWVLKSAADDITHIQWRVDSPHDKELNHYGDGLKIEFEIIH